VGKGAQQFNCSSEVLSITQTWLPWLDLTEENCCTNLFLKMQHAKIRMDAVNCSLKQVGSVL